MSAGTELVPAGTQAALTEIEQAVAQAKAQAEAIEVHDEASAALATTALRQFKQRDKTAEEKRLELVGPLNQTVKKINAEFKAAAAPFKEADQIIRKKVQAYADEQERIRREEEERLERERQDRERKAREERERQEAEARAKREQAEKEAREAEELRKAAQEKEDEEAAERLAEEARQKAEEAATTESAISSLPDVQLPKAVVPSVPRQEGVSQRKVWKHVVVDPNAVPREYLVVDEKAIRQAVRDGVREIPGVKIEQVSEMAVRA